MGSDDEYFEDEDDIDVDIDIVDPPIAHKNSEAFLTEVQLNKEIKLSLLLSQKDSLIKYLNRINVNKELVQLLNENINLIISNQIDDKNNKESNNDKNNSNNKTISINQTLNIDNEYVKNTQTFLSETVSLYHKINSKDSIVNNKNNKDVYRIKRFKKVLEEPKFDIPTIHSEIVQVTAPKEDIEKRVKIFTTSKKLENGRYNIVEFIDDSENSSSNDVNAAGSDANNNNNTSRCSAVPPSKMKITKTYNLTGPLDNISSSTIQQPFIDDRLSILENHLKLVVPPVPIDIYQRVKLIEQKMIALEEKNPAIFKELYDTMKQNSTVDHTSSSSTTTTTTTTVNKVLKQNSSNNNNNNTTTTTNSNSSGNRSDKPKITFKLKK
ncbi:hypothetical protein ACTFIR_004463 [Dictyostelium discoideum]